MQRHFWLPSLAADTREYVGACIKTTHRPPAGLLPLLPVPGHLWSHIVLDCVAGLPTSASKNTILTIVDRFSKAVHFVALAKLPSAAETAELMVEHVFRIHGIPLDIVSDRGPQFTSRVWKEFCRALGATASLSSGHHPQSNGQTERANQDLEDRPEMHMCPQSSLLEFSPHLGEIFPQLPDFCSHRYDTLRRFSWLLTTSLPIPGDRLCRAVGRAQPAQDPQDLEGVQSGSPMHLRTGPKIG